MARILLFSDPGIDDSLAIIYALLNPNIEIIGIVTGYGNVTEAQAMQNAAYLLTLAGREDIPVISGATRPLTGQITPYYPEIHGPEGLGPIRPPANISVNAKPFDTIFDIINRYQDELTIVSIGRLTSLAIGYIFQSKILDKIKNIFLMGGAFLVPGNVTPTAEANFFGDPIAANIVLQYGKNVHITPLNVTRDAVITPQLVNEVTQQEFNPFTRLISSVISYYINAYQKLVPGINGAPVHDLLTLSILTNHNFAGYVTKQVTVNVLDFAKGESIADFRPQPEFNPLKKTQNIFLQFNYQAFVRDFIRVLTSRLPQQM